MIMPTEKRAAFAIVWLALTFSPTACTFPEAHGKPRRPTADAGVRTSERKATSAKPDAGAKSKRRGGDPSSLIGRTQAQVIARRGSPTAKEGKEGNVWVYTPHRPGCRESIISEVVIFEGDEVVDWSFREEQTGKICMEPE
jgi:hypothetical protein